MKPIKTIGSRNLREKQNKKLTHYVNNNLDKNSRNNTVRKGKS